MDKNAFRSIPSIDNLLSDSRIIDLLGLVEREFLIQLIREITDNIREEIQKGKTPPNRNELIQVVVDTVNREIEQWPAPVINATGVVLHTNMGRAPLSEDALISAKVASEDYSDLELDLRDGKRGSRYSEISNLLRRLTGSEDAIVVNNNASAMFLGLAAIARGKEVIVSRGEASEIGGGFRIPDVLVQSGAKLVEVGTVNRTYAEDYQLAITSKTAAILLVHRSNFQVLGFTHEPQLSDISQVGRDNNIPVLHDLGSGALIDTAAYGLGHEPMPQESLADGSDLVFFSGDKLLGGPQSGIVVGNKNLISKLKAHPLARALRPEKLTLAALHQTLLHYLQGEATQKIPVWKMISMPLEELDERSRIAAEAIGPRAKVVDGFSAVGGGSLPTDQLPSKLISLSPSEHVKIEKTAEKIRKNTPHIIARIEDGNLIFDFRTVVPENDKEIIEAIKRVL